MAKAEKRGAEVPSGKLFVGVRRVGPHHLLGFGTVVSDCSRFRGFEVWIWGLAASEECLWCHACRGC